MQPIDIDGLVDELQARVARRRASGDYPPGLEAQLEAQFAAIMRATHRHVADTDALRGIVVDVDAAAAGLRAVVATSSRLPGGGTVHATAARLVQRHTGALAESMRSIAGDLSAGLTEVARLIDAQRSADERQLQDVIASILDRIALLDSLSDAVIDLERRLAALEAAVHRAADE